MNPIKKIKNSDPLETLLKIRYFPFKCMFFPEVGFLCSKGNYLE
jgi:hypothetical protein